jgi:hypothetical protein
MNSSQRLGIAIVIAGAVIAVGAAPTVADAGYTYTYIGNYFTSFSFSPPCCNQIPPPDPYSTSDRVTISLTFSSPLPNNSTTTTYSNLANPLSGYISDGVYSLNISSTFYDYGITLQTDASGQIITWDIFAGTWVNGDIGGVYANISSSYNGITGSDGVNAQIGGGAFIEGAYGATAEGPGNWASPVPISSLGAGIPGLIFACGGLLGLLANSSAGSHAIHLIVPTRSVRAEGPRGSF